MLDAQVYLAAIERDGRRILEVSEGRVEDPVPSCPGNTVGSLLLHATNVCLLWSAWLVANQRVPADWAGISSDVIDAFGTAHARVVTELRSRDPDAATWTWGRDQHVRFAYRRVAQELSIHRWDFENAVAQALPIDIALAADGVQEFLDEFSAPPPAPVSWRRGGFLSASQQFAGDGERLRFVAADIDASWTITARPDRFDVADDVDADVIARGTASDLNLFVWGRLGPEALDVTGDGSLLDRWHERVKI